MKFGKEFRSLHQIWHVDRYWLTRSNDHMKWHFPQTLRWRPKYHFKTDFSQYLGNTLRNVTKISHTPTQLLKSHSI